MKLPIKLNEAGWPSGFSRLSFAFHDPRPLAGAESSQLPPSAFSRAITTLQFGVTFKTTRPGRHQHSNRLMARLYDGQRPVVLDVGASDGSTSLDLIRELGANLGRFFVTDLNLSTRCGHDRHGVTYFFDRNGTCVLRASKRFLVYSEMKSAHFPLTSIARLLLSGARDVEDSRDVMLIQPSLIELASRDPRIAIERYDLFTPGRGDQPNLIKVANLLNPKYFSDAQMKEALRVQCVNLAMGGRLLLVSEDDDKEAFSVFRKSSTGMALEFTHGGAKAARHVPTTVAAPLHLNGKRGQPSAHMQ
jgi:hypothetical protein